MIRRQKIEDRDELSYEEKLQIAKKSDERCCHCGKKCYFDGFGATIDHFIPLSKGGTNRKINLIQLCKDCNDKKADKIMLPRHYLDYMKEDELEKISDYFISYVNSFEYVSRRNLLSCDEYEVEIIPTIAPNGRRVKETCFKYRATAVRATYEDAQDIYEYLEKYKKKYLPKYGLDTKECMEFWMEFGAIYYVKIQNEIKMVMCCTIADLPEFKQSTGMKHHISCMAFSYYRTNLGYTIANNFKMDMADFIMWEQKLDYLPLCWFTHVSDPFSELSYVPQEKDKESICSKEYVICNSRWKGIGDPRQDKECQSRVDEFFNKFTNVHEKIKETFRKKPEIEWMRMLVE